MTRLKWDMENNAEEWAEEARERIEDFPEETHALILGADAATVSPETADRFMSLAITLPGWADGPAYAREAILRYDE
jgi:hypothetical protein